jgi:two-component system chemotaxis response regulator CheY
MASDHKILIVEDDVDIREALEEALSAYGYKVLTANNGQEGLDILRAGAKPALVFLDLMMPVMGGREMLDIILQDEALKIIPIYIVSAAASATNTKGALGYLKKPVELDQVLELAEKYCGMPTESGL